LEAAKNEHDTKSGTVVDGIPGNKARRSLAADSRRRYCTVVMTDPIADFLTRIRNANMVYHSTVEIPASKVKTAMAAILKEEGLIKDFEVVEDGKQGIIRVYMKYGPSRERIISGLRRISKPGLRVYARKDQVPRVLGGLGLAILSTPKGIMTDKQARKMGLGGEVICYIW
jgi:small subunit ribosomal protein S8